MYADNPAYGDSGSTDPQKARFPSMSGVTTPGAAAASVAIVGGARVLFFESEASAFGLLGAEQSGSSSTGDGALLAPMPSRIALVHTAEGSSVNKGQRLIVKEAMKMELVLTAPFGGVVKTIKVKAGAQVAEGALLAVIGKGE
jgi:3-methylcrotonyl-CoA carboxylase alpha subunit